jgi:outer membrane protein OmpA-like peptidoglycan-associated protein
MRFSRAARCLAALALVAASGVPAVAQQTTPGAPQNPITKATGAPQNLITKATDLVWPATDLVWPATDLVWPAPTDLVFKIDDLGGNTQNLAGNIKDLKVKETSTEIRIDLAADVLFDFDKSTLRPSARAALHQVASIIRDNAKGRAVRIDGYTDSKGSIPYNRRLSERRAESVKSWLVAKEGLTNVNFETEGFGAKNPVAPNTSPDGSDNPDGRQKNRRVEVIVKKG